MFFATGAYTAAFWGKYIGGGDILLYLVLGGISSTVIGLVVGLFVVRYREIFFGMLNLAFSMVLWSLLEKMFHYTNGADGIRVARPGLLGFTFTPETFQYVILYVSLAVAVAAFYGVQRYLDSPLGHMLRAIKSNETRLEYLGMSARRVLLIGYVISAFLGGIGGTLVAIIQQIATPEFGFWTKSGEFVFIAILGGGAPCASARSPAPPMFEIVRFYAAAHLADAWQLILGVVLIVIILLRAERADRAPAALRPVQAGRALMANVLLSAQGHQDPVRRRDRGRRNRSRRSRRREPRHHRPERRRQDHVPQHLDRLSQSAGRHASPSSARTSPRICRVRSPGSASPAPSRFRSCSSTRP